MVNLLKCKKCEDKERCSKRQYLGLIYKKCPKFNSEEFPIQTFKTNRLNELYEFACEKCENYIKQEDTLCEGCHLHELVYRILNGER